MATVKVLVGIPASGKSTYAESLKKEGYKVHSSDAVREEILGNANSQEANKKVFRILYRRAIRDLRAGKDCVIDATNIKRKDRCYFLGLLEGIQCRKECIVFTTPVEVCKERNSKRERQVPDKTFRRMMKQFEWPQMEEGWDIVSCLPQREKWYCHIDDPRLDDAEGTAEKLYSMAAYLTAEQAEAVRDILEKEAALSGDAEQAAKLHTKADELRFMAAAERAEMSPDVDTSICNVEQIKLDILRGMDPDIDGIEISDEVFLSVTRDKGRDGAEGALVAVRDYSEAGKEGLGVTFIPFEELKGMSQKNFDVQIGMVLAHGMVYEALEDDVS